MENGRRADFSGAPYFSAGAIYNVIPAPWSNTRSMTFDGDDDYCLSDGTLSTALSDGPITVSFWSMLGYQSGSLTRWQLYIGDLDGGWNLPRWGITSTGTTAYPSASDLYFVEWDGYSGSGLLAPGTPIAGLLVEWNHIAFTSESTGSTGGAIKLYLNGSEVASGTGVAKTNISGPLTVALGAKIEDDGVTPSSYWPGNFDEVSIFNTALPATGAGASIETLYSGGEPADLTGLAGLQHWWRMGDKISGAVIPDQAGSLDMDAVGPVTNSNVPTTGSTTLVLSMDATPGGDYPQIVDGGPPSYNRFQVTTPINSGTGLIPRVLNQKSVTFDGVNQSYSSPIGAGPDFTVSGIGMTLNCNVKLNSITGTQPIFGQANLDSLGTRTAFMIYMVDATLVAIAADSTSGDWAVMGIVGGLVTGIWYTVTVTLVPGGTMTGYVWGNQYGTPLAISAGFGAAWSANRCWSIGAWRYGAVPNPPLTDFSNVQVDECAVFKHAWPHRDIIGDASKIYYRPDWSTPPVNYMIEFKGKLGYPLAWWRMGDTAGDSETQMLDAVFSDTESQSFNGTSDYLNIRRWWLASFRECSLVY